MSCVWTTADVEDRVRECVWTLARVPHVDRKWLRQVAAIWPDYRVDPWFGYGRYTTTLKPAKAVPDQITRMDETLDWLAKYFVNGHLPSDANRILWLRACRVPLRKIKGARIEWHRELVAVRGSKSVIPGGNSHEAIRGIGNRAAVWLTECLNRDQVPVRLPR